MRSFAEIEALAAARKGGPKALGALLTTPKGPTALAAIPDDRWLAEATRCVFQAGFSWKVIETKWPGFEAAFEGFDISRWARMEDADLDRLLKDARIVRNGAKVASVGANAAWFAECRREAGSVGAFFAGFGPERHMELFALLKARGTRLGGRTGQIFLRRMGVDALVFSEDVLKALAREGLPGSIPSSKKALAAVQAALDIWRGESGRGLTQISQILAFSVD